MQSPVGRLLLIVPVLLVIALPLDGRGFGGYRGAGGFGGYRGGMGGYRGGMDGYRGGMGGDRLGGDGGYRVGPYGQLHGGEGIGTAGWGDRGYAGGWGDRGYAGWGGYGYGYGGYPWGGGYWGNPYANYAAGYMTGTAENFWANTTAYNNNAAAAASNRTQMNLSNFTPGIQPTPPPANGNAAFGPYGGSSNSAAFGPYGGASSGGTSEMNGRAFATDGGMASFASAPIPNAGAANTGASASGAATAGLPRDSQVWRGDYVAKRADFVRSGFTQWDWFTPTWFTNYSGAWRPTAWTANEAWNVPTWATLAGLLGITTPPVAYDSANTVVLQGGNVYVNGVDQGSAQQYYQQGVTLAGQGAQAAPTGQWQSLGVFVLASPSASSGRNMFELAINSTGIIRGNYFDVAANQIAPVHGSIDKATQRAVWMIGDKKDLLFETGLENLTQSQTPVLIHFGPSRSEQWLLARLQNPATSK